MSLELIQLRNYARNWRDLARLSCSSKLALLLMISLSSWNLSWRRVILSLMVVTVGCIQRSDFVASYSYYSELICHLFCCRPGHYPDSNRRMDELEKKGLLFVGSGVSGGEEGARYGPSLSKLTSIFAVFVWKWCWLSRSFVIAHSARWFRCCLACYQGDLSEDCCSDSWGA